MIQDSCRGTCWEKVLFQQNCWPWMYLDFFGVTPLVSTVHYQHHTSMVHYKHNSSNCYRTFLVWDTSHMFHHSKTRYFHNSESHTCIRVILIWLQSTCYILHTILSSNCSSCHMLHMKSNLLLGKACLKDIIQQDSSDSANLAVCYQPAYCHCLGQSNSFLYRSWAFYIPACINGFSIRTFINSCSLCIILYPH